MSTEPEKKMSLEEFGAAIDAQTRTLPVRDAEAPRTVRVRIAVAVGERGDYAVAGWSRSHANRNEEAVMNAAREYLDSAWVVSCWIEADIPLPSQQTIRGEVTP